MDIPSLFLIEGIILLLFGVTMLVDSIGQDSQESNYWFAASNFCGALGLMLRRVFPLAPLGVTTLLPNLLLFLELTLVYKAVADFLGHGRKVWTIFLGLSLTATAVSAYALYWHPSRTLLANTISAVAILIPGSCAFLLFRYAMPEMRVSMYSMGTLFLLYTTNNLLRLWHDWVDPQARFYHVLFDRTILAVLSVSYLLMSEARLRRNLLNLARLDPLTGALNRRALEHEAFARIAAARRSRSDMSALMIDVDFFKTVNDRYGHHAGDAALRALGTLLKDVLRKRDVLIRVGGDEFLALLPGAGIAHAEETARRIKTAIAGLYIPSEQGAFQIQVSIGTASVGSGMVDLDDLIRTSDKSLYERKISARAHAAEA